MIETETIEALQWVSHEPVRALRGAHPDDPHRDYVVVGCHGPGCGWRSSEASYSTAGFAAHLQELGAPDYMVTYWQNWADIVELPWDEISRDAVARELADYTLVMRGATVVYHELSGLSKPNTAPEHVLRAAEEHAAERYADYLCDAAYDLLKKGRVAVAQEMVAVAEEWRAGCWRIYLQSRYQLRRLLRSREQTENRPDNVTFLRPSVMLSEEQSSDIPGDAGRCN